MMKKNQHPLDDVHMEISDLPEEQDASLSYQRVTKILAWLGRGSRFLPQKRGTQLLFTVICSVVVLLILLGSILHLSLFKNTTETGVPGPEKGPGLFYFQSLPSWSTVSLDGKVLSRVPTMDEGPPLRVGVGRHKLEWSSQPFKPFHCLLLVSVHASGGTCPLQKALVTPYAENAALIVLPISLKLLPDAQKVALTQAAQAALQEKQVVEVVHPGEHYAFPSSPQQVYTAHEPLRATQRFILDTDTTIPARCNGLSLGQGCSVSGSDCRAFCTLNQWPREFMTAPQWNIAAIFHSEWSYTTLSGKSLKAPQFVSGAYAEQFVALWVSWQEGTWYVAFHARSESSFDDPVCITTQSTIVTDGFSQRLKALSGEARWIYMSHLPLSGGCLAAAWTTTGTLEPASVRPSIMLLQRFGVLMTINEPAHRLWPELPSASVSEQRLAQNLLAANL